MLNFNWLDFFPFIYDLIKQYILFWARSYVQLLRNFVNCIVFLKYILGAAVLAESWKLCDLAIVEGGVPNKENSQIDQFAIVALKNEIRIPLASVPTCFYIIRVRVRVNQAIDFSVFC